MVSQATFSRLRTVLELSAVSQSMRGLKQLKRRSLGAERGSNDVESSLARGLRGVCMDLSSKRNEEPAACGRFQPASGSSALDGVRIEDP